MVTSVNPGNSNTQALQQATQAEKPKPTAADEARQRDAEEAKRQAAAAQAAPAKKPAPTVNTQGQTTGSIINTTA
jgi:hypothetical protein